MDEKGSWGNGMDKKILILSQTTKDDYALMEWKKNGADVDITLKEHSLLLRALRRYWIKWHLPFQHIWYGDWKKTFMDYDGIILHGTWLAEDIPHWMQRKIKKNTTENKTKIIWWYWNTVVEQDHPDRVSPEDCEKWSFDKKDCEKYHMNYNTQYYFKSYEIPQNKILHDVYFLGTDGGRMQKIQEIYHQLKQFQMDLDFHILVSKIPEEVSIDSRCFITNKMEYKENLKHIGESKAILEILRDGQSGQTLRALECLFFKKKLITNDSNVKKYEFYHPNNIFILGENSIENLPEFMQKQFVEIDPEIVDKYDCKAWMERFFEEE